MRFDEQFAGQGAGAKVVRGVEAVTGLRRLGRRKVGGIMTRYVALLRGVNVGGNRKVPMPELRQVFESQGFADVSTYIQSGNVLFSAEDPVSPPDLEAAIADRFGIEVDVVVRTPADLHRIIEGNPFPVTETKVLHVGFMVKAPEAANLKLLDLAPFEPEAAEVRGSEIYFYLPNGMGRTKLPTYVNRQLKAPTTVRNWNTTTKLWELASS